jgi:predicted 3-demethylubiquinone-9 3-methyltransferase (glyoxalase superfamily)
MPRITPNLWFATEAEEAAEYYVSIFPDSTITGVTRYGASGPMPEGTVMTVDFLLDGQPFTAINGGDDFPFTEAVSLLIDCADQDEIDHYWDRLTDGGAEVQCGWLKDRYGLSWQVFPTSLNDLFAGPDTERAERAMQAMFAMKKIDMAALRAAAEEPDHGVVPSRN